ncbi:MAG: uroporphyrinogen decarboxylase [Alphaproteobacteria bacterium]|nr:uroporphyrinogen decarboxylase [Alphaproteobacteria bacterium]
MHPSTPPDTGHHSDRRLLQALSGTAVWPPPVWLMRQAGRYLPEYRATRATAGGFMDLCLSVDHAVEVTHQPLRRYQFDAAILFSDILMVPYGLGQAVWFAEGEGPKLTALRSRAEIDALSTDQFHDRLSAIYQIVSRLRAEIPAQTTLLGFAGAPWTIATYMFEGGSSKSFETAKRWLWHAPDDFAALIERVTDATIQYLRRQIDAGADAVQLFDSWASALGGEAFERWVIEPNARIVAALKDSHPATPVICFPRAAGVQYRAFAQRVKPAGLSLDPTVPLDWARGELAGCCLQGNLDPLLLVTGGDALRREVDRIGEAMRGYPFIFNLGHGIVPQTPPEHVTQLVEQIRGW